MAHQCRLNLIELYPLDAWTSVLYAALLYGCLWTVSAEKWHAWGTLSWPMSLHWHLQAKPYWHYKMNCCYLMSPVLTFTIIYSISDRNMQQECWRVLALSQRVSISIVIASSSYSLAGWSRCRKPTDYWGHWKAVHSCLVSLVSLQISHLMMV